MFMSSVKSIANIPRLSTAPRSIRPRQDLAETSQILVMSVELTEKTNEKFIFLDLIQKKM